MKTLTKDLVMLAKLASYITLDKFSQINSVITNLKKENVNPEKIYETILQSYLFCGFPAAIESLTIFRKNFPNFQKRKTVFNHVKFRKSGITNCKLVYKNNFKKLIENMNYYSRDLRDWMIIEGYGKVLGRTGLNLLEREYINVSMLVTRFYKNQLHSHLRGCLYMGASKNELNSLFNQLEKVAGIKNITQGKKLLQSISIFDN